MKDNMKYGLPIPCSRKAFNSVSGKYLTIFLMRCLSVISIFARAIAKDTF